MVDFFSNLNSKIVQPILGNVANKAGELQDNGEVDLPVLQNIAGQLGISEEKYEKNTVNVFRFCAELRVFIPTLNRFCLLSAIKFLMYSIHTYLKTTCICSYQMEMEFLCLLFSL